MPIVAARFEIRRIHLARPCLIEFSYESPERAGIIDLVCAVPTGRPKSLQQGSGITTAVRIRDNIERTMDFLSAREPRSTTRRLVLAAEVVCRAAKYQVTGFSGCQRQRMVSQSRFSPNQE